MIQQIVILRGNDALTVSSPQTDDRDETAEDSARPDVPEEVLRGIDDLEQGNTVGKEELKQRLDN